jgi:hypothetical protein
MLKNFYHNANKCAVIFRVMYILWMYILISVRLMIDFNVIQTLSEVTYVEANNQNGHDIEIVNPPTGWKNFMHFYVIFISWWATMLNVLIWVIVGCIKVVQHKKDVDNNVLESTESSEGT